MRASIAASRSDLRYDEAAVTRQWPQAGAPKASVPCRSRCARSLLEYTICATNRSTVQTSERFWLFSSPAQQVVGEMPGCTTAQALSTCPKMVQSSRCGHLLSGCLQRSARRHVRCSDVWKCRRSLLRGHLCPSAMFIAKSMLHSSQCRVQIPDHCSPSSRAEAVRPCLSQRLCAHRMVQGDPACSGMRPHHARFCMWPAAATLLDARSSQPLCLHQSTRCLVMTLRPLVIAHTLMRTLVHWVRGG